MRLILIHNIITPYINPVFNHLSEVKGTDFRVIFLAPTDSNRAWHMPQCEMKFDYKILKNFHFYIQSKEVPIYFHWGLWREIHKFKPGAICICGYHYLATIESLIYAKLMNIPIILWAGSHLLSGFVKNRVTHYYKKFIIPRFDSYITYGTAATEQIIHYGAKPDKIITGCNTVDIEWYMKRLEEIKEDEIKEIKKKYPLKSILYVGAFIERKGVFNLIKAFEKLNVNDVGLILIGKGKEEEQYRNYIKQQKIKNVFFEGFKQKEEIVKYYKIADVFVLPSLNEVWALVVNEAMACGLPILSSIYAGATKDLVKDGENGFSFNPNDIDELAEKLKELITNDNKRKEMGKKSLEIIREHTPQKYAESILKAAYLVKL